MTSAKHGSTARNVLVVDDDPISREIVALLLASEGHRVTKTSSGQDALNAMSHLQNDERPNAILVDLNMPGLRGEKLAERLRSSAGAGVRILAMSASEPSSTARFDGFLRKPLDRVALATMLGSSIPAPTPAIPAAHSPHSMLDNAVFFKLESMMLPQAVNEILEACIQDIRQKLPLMKERLKAGELKSLQQAAHTIKGGSLMIGAGRISAIAAKLEMGSYQLHEGLTFLEELSSACNELQRILLERKAAKALVI